MLSGVVHNDLLAPPSGEAANAQAILQNQAGSDFQVLTADLQRIEQASQVRKGEFAVLESDIATLDHAIETASTISVRQATLQMNELQNVLDQSFLAGTYRSGGWKQLEQKVAASLTGVIVNQVMNQSSVKATMPNGVVSNQLVQDTFNQMRLIAREASVTTAEHARIVADQQAILRDLGPDPNVNLGGALPRNPLTVYLDAQVPAFVKVLPAVRRR